MKKRSLVLLFVVLTLCFAFCGTTVALAADGNEAEITKLTTSQIINISVVYGVFLLSLIVGIPCIKAVNRRKRAGYVDDIVKAAESVAEKLNHLYEKRNEARNKSEILRFAIKVSAVADMALTTYTQKQIGGYYEIYNDLNSIKNRLTEIEKIKDAEKYTEEFQKITAKAEAVVQNAKKLAENEKIIRRYNG